MKSDEEGSVKKRSEKPTENLTVSLEKSELKLDKSDVDDPKPRIVLTFRSEKSNTKSNNMKIVSTEEKHEEVSPRRSSRTRGKWDWVCDDTSPKKDNQPASETDESDSSHAPPKRTRRRSKDENIIANAIARKIKSYNESTPGPTQRLSRRIKPTAKVLANKELRIGFESQNNARLGLSDRSPEEGVRTRRSAKPAQNEEKQKVLEKLDNDMEVVEIDDDSQNSDMKVKHLCKLGLKAIELEAEDSENKEICEEAEVDDDEEIDDDSEVISKLLEADEDSDDEFLRTSDSYKSTRPRRSTRVTYSIDDPGVGCSSGEEVNVQISGRSSRRKKHAIDSRSTRNQSRTRRKRKSSGVEEQLDNENDESNPAGGDEGAEAVCPPEESAIVATCLCEASSNVYADPEDLPDPVFCQAVCSVEGVRVGCSHGAGAAALLRAGPRAPYLLPCALHTAQLHKHMCCPACGLFCTQGIFYQCSKGHLFHLECSLPYNDSKQKAGCPHCGVYSYRWQPVNTDCWKVHVQMNCSNKRIFLPDQREQCTPAYLSFSSKEQVEISPVIPEDLLPPPSLLKQLKETKPVKCTAQELCNAILVGEPVEQIIPKIGGKILNKGVSSLEGGTCAHAAAKSGNATLLHLLHTAGANISATDNVMRTPLMVAVLALVEKTEVKKEDADTPKDGENVNVKNESEIESAEEKTREEDLLKVIRYLVAAGCDVDIAEQHEGLTALHVCAAAGRTAAGGAVAARAQLDQRDAGGWTPLVWAAENDHLPFVKMLLSLGADPVSLDSAGSSAAAWCAGAGAARCLHALLDAAPHAITLHNQHGDTPLHLAARQGHYACVVILLARGAKCDVENSAGELPIDVCAGACHTAISLNMQMKMRVKDNPTMYKLLSSDISNGREELPIPCVNEVDDAPLPTDFTYVTQHVTPHPLTIDTSIETMQGCSCAEGACGGPECACVVVGVRGWWGGGRLRAAFPHHDPPLLFHCNHTCSCNHKRCTNNTVSRLLSRGSVFVSCSVRRVSAAVGWGLCPRVAVPRGAPVAAYCGELLPLAEADTRTDDSYMFALDVKPDLLEQCLDKTLLCVDARRYSNAARFVNHSCSPNLAPVRIFTHTRDLRLPNIVLFALRDIQPGEEFTFDYGDKFWSVKSKFMKCECGSPDCRYPVKATEETDS